jgi:hypothetical protein
MNIVTPGISGYSLLAGCRHDEVIQKHAKSELDFQSSSMSVVGRATVMIIWNLKVALL